MVKIATQGGDGSIAFAQESVVITCNEAVTKGDLVRLVLANGKFSACELSDASDNPGEDGTGLFGVASDAVSAGNKGRIVLRGVVDVQVDSQVTAVSKRLRASRDHDGNLDLHPVPADDNVLASRILAISLTAGGGVDGNLISALFDGINGFAATGTDES